ncbi:hypothetical protein [Streptomyces sp. DH37]|uniref:hypothetical protein n=1 Tax=Streptomyces sp. DH37 TaxID=3040122 RepID=UPI002442FF04|nr:hypothetical protein [Streptomyces sp. DH37]MDG9702413.1 hypothetical protein [Streptomyces sp. DH37]
MPPAPQARRRDYRGTRLHRHPPHPGQTRSLGRRTAKQRLTPGGEAAEEILFTWDGTRPAEETNRVTHTLPTWNRDATAYTPLRFPCEYHDTETDERMLLSS